MINASHSINRVTFLLAWVAGYCDTVTFISGDAIFSAHVTGNFIVFAAQAVNGGSGSWIKLLTFPVFVLAVILGGKLATNTEKRHRILLAESLLLILCGLVSIALPVLSGSGEKWCIYLIVMTVVLAMGLQNAFGKLFAKETHGPTTMMTGNVTQASLDLGSLLSRKFNPDNPPLLSLKKQGYTIGGFLAGCLLGALCSRFFGLSALILPGVSMFICYYLSEEADS